MPEFKVNSDRAYAQLVADLSSAYAEHRYLVGDWRTGKQRSSQQRKAIEVYCRELAKALNEAGYDQRKTMAIMREGVEIPWAQASVKNTLWREVQKATMEKESTTDLERPEVSRVYDIINRWTSEKMGVSVMFPEAKDEK